MEKGEIMLYQPDEEHSSCRKKCDNLKNEVDYQNDQLENIEPLIQVIRGQQVLLDRDLAMLYGVETKRLNEQVKRNIERFPKDFMFQLTAEEAFASRSQFATLKNCEEALESQSVTLNVKRGQNVKFRPFAFTENGIAMLSGILRSPTAINVNIHIMRAFTSMRHFVAANAQVFHRLEVIEHHQLELSTHLSDTDCKLDEVFRRLDKEAFFPNQGIFYDGQIFDAYRFVSDLIRSAKHRIVLFDNYIDDTVLTLLDKRDNSVPATIFTKAIPQQLALDIVKHNAQYAPIEVKTLGNVHDRFLCIDDTVYHIGASLKDLGKKLFAFSRMEVTATELMQRKF